MSDTLPEGSSTAQPSNKQRRTVFQKLSLFFFDRPVITAVLAVAVLAFGLASYSVLLKREGFPSVNIPFSSVTGAYLVNDPSRVDKEITKPLSDTILKVPGVKNVQSQASDNFFSVFVEFKEGTSPEAGDQAVERAVRSAGILPQQATAAFEPVAFGVTQRGDDAVIAFYAEDNQQSLEALTSKAKAATTWLKEGDKISLADDISIIDPFARGVDPRTGSAALSQSNFERFGTRTDNENRFFQAVTIGIKGDKGFDVLKLDEQIQVALRDLNNNSQFENYRAELAFSQAADIKGQIDNLQTALLEGLLAVLVISAILIALRASIIIVSSMVLVLTVTLGVLYAIGYSLNTITLFALVLSLSLIVDDTIIMVEAIDAQRRRIRTARAAVSTASKKISRAMIAATLTATIGFAPLIFTSGILGSFIRAIPVTVILSLVVSLVVALTVIPFMSRLLLLRPKQMAKLHKRDTPVHKVEEFVARSFTRPLYWTHGHRGRLWGLGLSAVVIGLGFILAGGWMFQKVSFNIFAPSKDSDGLVVAMTFPPNTSIDDVQRLADRADGVIAKSLGPNFKQASYFSSGDTRGASLNVDLISFKDREPTSPELAKKVEKDLNNSLKTLKVKVNEEGVGPPTGAFAVRIETDKREAAYRLANSMVGFLEGRELKRLDGSVARLKAVSASNPSMVSRDDGKQYVQVSAEFDGSDTSTLVLLAQQAVQAEYTDKRLATYNLNKQDLVFDFGSESENQDSFKSLLIAFPVLLIVIYILLVLQFRSLLQPLLIFMAIPFSLFGITTSLWATDNAFSFFTMLGFFALIGLSIKNTILLTDYANQSRRGGQGAVDAIASALKERFRPLVATSLTAIVSLIPLIRSNPFWEGLGITLIFGLLSSTLLVITVFPYYYLGAEYLRQHISRLAFGLWLAICLTTGAVIFWLGGGLLAGLGLIVASLLVPLLRRKLNFARSSG